jgi:hypothetical protein
MICNSTRINSSLYLSHHAEAGDALSTWTIHPEDIAMANETGKPAGAEGPKPDDELARLKAELERQKVAALSQLLKHSLAFVALDMEANAKVLELATFAVAYAKANQDTVFSVGKGNIDDLVNALRSGSAPKGGGVTGGDVVGGDTVIDDIIQIINALINLITGGEKDFFLAIIRLIFCGC